MKLRPEQIEAIELMVDKRKLALFFKPGGGKTAIALHTIARINPKHALIIAPIRVCDTVWKQEAKKWPDTSHLTFNRLKGSPAKRLALYRDRVPKIDLISYSLLAWLAKTTKLAKYDCIVFDELSMLKAPGTVRFRAIRSRLKKIPYRFGLTGTPVGNSLLNYWAEMWCIGDDKPLGPRFTDWRARHFQEVYDHIWKPFPDTESKIKQAVAPWVLSRANSGYDDKLFLNPQTLVLPAKTMKQYKKFESNYFITLDDTNIGVFSQLSVSMKLRQLAGGMVYDNDGVAHHLHEAKQDYLKELVGELQGGSLLIFYQFKWERQRIEKELGPCHIDRPDAIGRWNRRESQFLLAHPKSAGHGLNLQDGGNTILWYSLPWSFELFDQANARLDRSGQTASTVVVHVPLVEDTIDFAVWESLQKHASTDKSMFQYFQKWRENLTSKKRSVA